MGTSLIVTILLFVLGLILVIKGGDYFVDAATWVADISGIPKFVIGATVVSMATTLPELLVSVFAAFEGKTDMAIGNAVGSVTANTALIMAISIICLPAFAPHRDVGLKSIFLILSIGLLFAFSLDGSFTPLEGVVIMVIFVFSIVESLMQGKKATSERKLEELVEVERKEVIINIIKFVGGAAGIVFGADLMVDYGSELARFMGVSEAIIGATLVAVGTSLPELVTTITAIVKKESSLSIGNIIGANVIDVTLILPVCAFLTKQDIPVTGQNLYLDIPACLIVIVVGLVPILIRQRYNRPLGAVLLALYGAYLYIMLSGVYMAWF
ncbi:MAG: calcium/sodium antiporter [Clostridia bacterium]|nr:calcium/sodium antiporter [Clostridia bacterium]